MEKEKVLSKCSKCEKEVEVLISNCFRNNQGTKIVLPLEYKICSNCVKEFNK